MKRRPWEVPLAYPPHLRLVWGGTIFDREEFSCSLRLAPRGLIAAIGTGGPLPDTPDPEPLLDDMVNDLRTFWTVANNGISTAARVTWVKLNPIGPDGFYANKTRTTERRLSGAATFVGTSQAYLPPQCAMAVTLRSARGRGVLSRGRFFVPFGGSVDGTGLAPNAQCLALATGAATLVKNLANQAGLDTTGLAPVLVSPGGRNQPEGGAETITRVEVGRVIDTQRRRRNQFPEGPPASAAVPT
jgi:hypothetical protein